MAAPIYTKNAFTFVAKVGGGIYRFYVSIVLFLFQTICLVEDECNKFHVLYLRSELEIY